LVDPGDRMVKGIGLRLLACWVCGFEYRRLHRCASLVNVMWCQVAVSETGSSLVQGSPTECHLSLLSQNIKNEAV